MDIKKLKRKLVSLKFNQFIPEDPLRGLEGELRKKMLAGLAGHRSGNLTAEELIKIKKIQSDYDCLHSKNGEK